MSQKSKKPATVKRLLLHSSLSCVLVFVLFIQIVPAPKTQLPTKRVVKPTTAKVKQIFAIAEPSATKSSYTTATALIPEPKVSPQVLTKPKQTIKKTARKISKEPDNAKINEELKNLSFKMWLDGMSFHKQFSDLSNNFLNKPISSKVQSSSFATQPSSSTNHKWDPIDTLKQVPVLNKFASGFSGIKDSVDRSLQQVVGKEVKTGIKSTGLTISLPAGKDARNHMGFEKEQVTVSRSITF